MSKTIKQLQKICDEIYTELFKQSLPTVDINKLFKNGTTKRHDWFMDYYLPMNRQNDIIINVCKKYNLSTWDRQKISEEIHTGYSPNSCKETWSEG